MLKKLIRILILCSCFIFMIPVTKDIKLKQKIDNIILNNLEFISGLCSLSNPP